MPPKPPKEIAGGRFEIQKAIGAGCFGQVWRGIDKELDNEMVAIKFEDNQAKGNPNQLKTEYDLLRIVSAADPHVQGFSKAHMYGVEGRFSFLAMTMLGRSLEDRMHQSGKKLTPQSVVLIADQVLRRMEFLHSLGLIHRDIKPENFMFGVKNRIHVIHLIDFGLSKRYYDGRHATMRTNLSLTGTARYASINAHRGIEQSRRDDLEAIGHMLMCFLRGTLPWSGLQAKTQEEKYRKIREKKEQTPLEELCAEYPEAFKVYLQKTRGLDFTERPDYHALRKLFSNLRQETGPQEDHGFQFLKGNLGQLDPLEIKPDVLQPDDQVPVKSSRGCCTIS
mmetsp:Transcript_38503/g.78730  ORF Transcript_38503/g.78730 Transcript_38503/m.78730 type:complete len:336 (-) Transcript_38503:50-1057(-)